MKKLIDEWESNGVDPGTYHPDMASVKKRAAKTPVWRESSTMSAGHMREEEEVPGPVRVETLQSSPISSPILLRLTPTFSCKPPPSACLPHLSAPLMP